MPKNQDTIVVEGILAGHRQIKSKNSNYPALPRTVRGGGEIYNMSDESYKHFESCYSGFEKRLKNYHDAEEKMMEKYYE